ncbi:hypothetical protein CGC58_02395 [Capnocytophaga stomatis]|uniref:Uncharacterized protein n=1 Tax=Capnocytophaga stomatis TaxID=1848904 RepID=A0A250FXK6_9FLAO|nr:hypothetical protein CGC58_02395 [Capnocytophaga stomatis]
MNAQHLEGNHNFLICASTEANVGTALILEGNHNKWSRLQGYLCVGTALILFVKFYLFFQRNL